MTAQKRQKLELWKALDRDTGQRVDWECGRRDAATVQRLVHRLARWDVTCYDTDHWKSSAARIPAAQWVMSTAHTEGIEHTPCRQQ